MIANDRFLHYGDRIARTAESPLDLESLAAHLSVPFHFASPDTPDDEAPRWRP